MATDESWLARPHRQHTAAPHVPRRGAPGRFVLIHPLYCPIPSHSQIATRSTRNRPARLHSNSLPSPKPASPQPPSFSTSTPPRVSSRLRPPTRSLPSLSTAMASRLAVAVAVPASSPSPVATVAPPRVALRRGLPPTWHALRALLRSRGAAVVCQAQGGQDTAIQGMFMPA
jgi:hypothetical protein